MIIDCMSTRSAMVPVNIDTIDDKDEQNKRIDRNH